VVLAHANVAATILRCCGCCHGDVIARWLLIIS